MVNSETSASSGSVLVVDDDDGVREVVGQILADEGYRVLFAESPMSAARILRHERVALVLLDHVMPQRSAGEQAFSRTGTCPPIVLFTAWTDPAPIASKIGAVGWLRKPFEVEDLLAIVRKHAARDS